MGTHLQNNLNEGTLRLFFLNINIGKGAGREHRTARGKRSHDQSTPSHAG
jgi:hypothetical protein